MHIDSNIMNFCCISVCSFLNSEKGENMTVILKLNDFMLVQLNKNDKYKINQC